MKLKKNVKKLKQKLAIYNSRNVNKKIKKRYENIKNRQAIRETWCNPISYKHPQNAWQCLFLIGQSHSRDFQKSLDDEFNLCTNYVHLDDE
jgi:hypothetical protein